MPLQIPVGLEVFRHLVGGEGGVEPRLQRLVSEDSRHAVVDATEGRVGVDCDHRVREQGLLLREGRGGEGRGGEATVCEAAVLSHSGFQKKNRFGRE